MKQLYSGDLQKAGFDLNYIDGDAVWSKVVSYGDNAELIFDRHGMILRVDAHRIPVENFLPSLLECGYVEFV